MTDLAIRVENLSKRCRLGQREPIGIFLQRVHRSGDLVT